MIMQSRRWRLAIRFVTLVITSALMLAFAGPVSYALQDDTPKSITSPRQLSDKEQPVANSYANVKGVLDVQHAFVVKDGSDTYYWIPLLGYGRELFVRTQESRYVFPHDAVAPQSGPAEGYFAGKITSLSGEASADEALEKMAALGIEVDKEKAMVLLQGEVPKAYRPMVPVIPVLAWLWLAALVGIVQIWRRRPARRRLSQAAVPVRPIR
jgi:hypothetical protein